MQQPSQLAEIMEDERPDGVVGLRRLGDAVSAESRNCLRVCTALADLHAEFGEQMLPMNAQRTQLRRLSGAA